MGLYYDRARYYDATTGRFVGQDPLGFDAGDVNLYRYTFNSPTNYIDPSGLYGQLGGYEVTGFSDFGINPINSGDIVNTSNNYAFDGGIINEPLLETAIDRGTQNIMTVDPVSETSEVVRDPILKRAAQDLITTENIKPIEFTANNEFITTVGDSRNFDLSPTSFGFTPQVSSNLTNFGVPQEILLAQAATSDTFIDYYGQAYDFSNSPLGIITGLPEFNNSLAIAGAALDGLFQQQPFASENNNFNWLQDVFLNSKIISPIPFLGIKGKVVVRKEYPDLVPLIAENGLVATGSNTNLSPAAHALGEHISLYDGQSPYISVSENSRLRVFTTIGGEAIGNPPKFIGGNTAFFDAGAPNFTGTPLWISVHEATKAPGVEFISNQQLSQAIKAEYPLSRWQRWNNAQIGTTEWFNDVFKPITG